MSRAAGALAALRHLRAAASAPAEPGAATASWRAAAHASPCAGAACAGAARGAAAAARGEPAGAAAPLDEADRRRRARLLYRARQRGWLELDLLVGAWAARALPTLPPAGLDDLEALLAEENPDLFKWLTGQLPPPPALAANGAFAALRAEVAAATAAGGAAGAAAKPGAAWVRGWDDWRATTAPAAGGGAQPAGNQ